MIEQWQQPFIDNGWQLVGMGPWRAVESPDFAGTPLTLAIPDLESDPLENAVMILRIATQAKQKLLGKKSEATNYNIDSMGDGDVIVEYLSELRGPETKEQLLEFLELHTMAMFAEI